MIYTRYVPLPPLNAYIDDIYYCDGSAPYSRLKILPMPSLHLMVNLGAPFHAYEPDQSKPFMTCAESWSLGLWSHYHIVEWPLNVRFFGIHFKPGGAYPFLQLPLSELHNQIIPSDAMLGRFAAELREQLNEAPTTEAGFALLERWLLNHLCKAAHGLDVVQYAIGQIAAQHGALSIRALSDDIGISQNHLLTQFKRMVGISPKELGRFYRFANILRSLDPTQPIDWTRVAHHFCFYDQSHFNKDFKAFTGHNPGDYLRLRRRVAAENPEQAENIGQMPLSR